MRINDAAMILIGMKMQVHTDDLETTLRVEKENEAIDTALKYIYDTIALYEEWAVENDKHVRETCKRYSQNLECPIEKEYAIVKDGHCHLWEDAFNRKGEE